MRRGTVGNVVSEVEGLGKNRYVAEPSFEGLYASTAITMSYYRGIDGESFGNDYYQLTTADEMHLYE